MLYSIPQKGVRRLLTLRKTYPYLDNCSTPTNARVRNPPELSACFQCDHPFGVDTKGGRSGKEGEKSETKQRKGLVGNPRTFSTANLTVIPP